MDEPSWITQPGTPSSVQSIIDANQPDSATGGEIPMNCTSGILATVNRGDEEAASTDLPGILKMIQQAGITDPAQQAYILATAQTEDDFTPRDEGRDKLINSGSAGIYTGRGDVQLTGRSNYQYWTNRLGVDLIDNPELANRPDLSAEILVYGMRDGTFTGRKLSQYINSSTGHFDFAGARHIVNDSDKTGTTAEAAQRFYTALKDCSSSTSSTGSSSGSGGTITTQQYPGKLISSADGNATEQKITQAINARYGESSANDPNTGGGVNACAYEVNLVLQDAIGHKIGGSAFDNVVAVNQSLNSGSGTAINASEAHAGDIIISPGDAHIGFCISDGCSQVLSNSSSKGHFSWVTSLSGWNSYWQQKHSGQSQFYRVNG
jgi:hypothetical protein